MCHSLIVHKKMSATYHQFSAFSAQTIQRVIQTLDSLTKAQIEQLEFAQKRAVRIILNFSRGMP